MEAPEPPPSTDLMVSPPTTKPGELWPEPLDTPGYIPNHIKRSATSQFPILEIVQRLLYRLKPGGGDLEKVLAVIGLYQAIHPAYKYLKQFCIWAFTVQVTIPETDMVAREVLAWMGSEVILNSRTRSAMLVTGGLQDENDAFHRHMVRKSNLMPSRSWRHALTYRGTDDGSRPKHGSEQIERGSTMLTTHRHAAVLVKP
jgi:chaperone BCS1